MHGESVRPWMAFAGFAVFGALWGVWGASIPAIRNQAGVTQGQLGTALLFVGAGALPAMPLSGRAVDRWGLRATAAFLAMLGGAGLLVAAAARDFVTLALGLALLGASSGAADVAINTAAGSAQRATERPVVTRAHAMFSAAVVGASLLAGALRALDAPFVSPFVVVTGGAVAVATAFARAGLDPQPRVDAPTPGDAHAGAAPPRGGRPPAPLAPLLVLGGLGALARNADSTGPSGRSVWRRPAGIGHVVQRRP